MSPSPEPYQHQEPRRWHWVIAAGVLVLPCVMVLRPFVSSILWAAILAYITWKPYRMVRARCRGSDTIAASIMTVLVVVIALVPLFGILMLLQHELRDAYKAVTTYLAEAHVLPPAIRAVPWLGVTLQEAMDRFSGNPGAIQAELLDTLQRFKSELIGLLGGIGRNIGKILTILLTLFFCYRDGSTLTRQCRRLSRRFLGAKLVPFIETAGQITRAVLYGFLVTVVAQGLIAGIGYWLFGVPEPVLLGVMTGLFSILPVFGTGFVWVPAAVYLLASDHVLKGILLLLWGILIVHPTDNLLRPLVISSVARLPFLTIMFGVVGGLAAFGLVGIVVGPVLLGLGAELWAQLTITPSRARPRSAARASLGERQHGDDSS
jgi:predicted PurR-regulated permease PerM